MKLISFMKFLILLPKYLEGCVGKNMAAKKQIKGVQIAENYNLLQHYTIHFGRSFKGVFLTN